MNDEIILHITDPDYIEGEALFENGFCRTHFFTLKMFNGVKLQFYGNAHTEDNTLHVDVEYFTHDQ